MKCTWKSLNYCKSVWGSKQSVRTKQCHSCVAQTWFQIASHRGKHGVVIERNADVSVMNNQHLDLLFPSILAGFEEEQIKGQHVRSLWFAHHTSPKTLGKKKKEPIHQFRCSQFTFLPFLLLWKPRIRHIRRVARLALLWIIKSYRSHQKRWKK